MRKGIWVNYMPAFEDWVLLQQPEMSEQAARSYGDSHVCLEPDAKLTRRMTFEVCALMVKFRRLEDRLPRGAVGPVTRWKRAMDPPPQQKTSRRKAD